MDDPRDNHISFFQLNCDGRKVTEHILPKEQDTIVLFQEPYLSKQGRPFALRRQKFYPSPNGRVAIYVPDLMVSSFSEIPELVRDDMVAGLLEWGNQSLVVASIYMHKNLKNPCYPNLDILTKYCKKYNKPFLCGADTNSWNEMWFSERTHINSDKPQWKRGDELEEYFQLNEISVVNSYPQPTFVRRGNGGTNKTTIDLTLTRGFDEQILDWQVNSHCMASDHKPITYKFRCPKGVIQKCRNFYKADWSKFANIINAELPALKDGKWSQVRIENELEAFYKCLYKALDTVCPERPRRLKHGAIWWNEDCEKAKGAFKSIQRQVFRRCRSTKSNPSDEEWELIKNARREWTNTISRARREAWRDFTSQVDSTHDAAKLNKVLNSNPTHDVGLLRKGDGTMCTNSNETINVLLGEHFPRCEIGTDVPYSPKNKKVHLKEYTWISPLIVKKAIDEFGPHKAPGPDQIKPVVLQNLPEKGLTRLSVIFKACIQFEYTPHRWRKSIVSFMAKANKPDKANPRTYRPLSLNSFILKSLEKVIKFHLEEEVFQQNPRHKKQFAFQKGRGTDDALSHTINAIEKGLLRGQYVIAVFLDIQGAFDNIHPDAINKAMKDSNIPPYIRKWYHNLLTNRECECTIGITTLKAKLNSGIPQGAVLSPPVGWNPSMDKLLIIIDAEPVDQASFADDEAIVAASDDPLLSYRQAQRAINAAVFWAEEHGLKFSASKTQALFMTTKVKYIPPPKLRLYGEEVEYVDHVKYLGLTIDRHLNWDRHIKDKINSTKRVLIAANRALANVWGPKPKYCLWIWTAVLRPRITYGAFVWAKAAAKRHNQNRLRSVQRLALTMSAPMRKSTPSRALEIIFNVAPLHLHIKALALATFVRIDANLTWNSSRKTKGHIEYALNEIPTPLLNAVMDKAPERRDWNLRYDVIIGNGINDAWHHGSADWSCFTDGSLLEGESGAGAVIFDRQGDITSLGEKPDGGTVFQCEVWAIEMAANWLLDMVPKPINRKILFFVDSQSALRSIEAIVSNKITVNRARSALKKLSFLNEVTLTWVKAHRKDADKAAAANELADAAARQATMIEPAGSITAPLSLSGAKNIIKARIWQEWKKEWDWYPEARQSHYLIGGPSLKYNQIYKFGKDTVSRLVQYLTGHAFLGRHDQIVELGNKEGDGSEAARCRFCKGADETPHHILTECEPLTLRRVSWFGHQRLNKSFHNWKIHQILGFMELSDLDQTDELTTPDQMHEEGVENGPRALPADEPHLAHPN